MQSRQVLMAILTSSVDLMRTNSVNRTKVLQLFVININIFIALLFFYSGQADVALLKYNSEGTRVWSRLDGGVGNEFGRGVAVSPSGDSIYVVGYSTATVNLQTYLGGGRNVFLRHFIFK